MPTRFWTLAAAAAAFAATAPAAAQEPPDSTLPGDMGAKLIAAGKTVFEGAGNCFACHGAAGKGTPLAPDLTDGAWLHGSGTFAELTRVIKEGIAQPKEHPAPMPAMGGASLSEDQVRAVTAYVWSLARAAEEETGAAGRSKPQPKPEPQP